VVSEILSIVLQNGYVRAVLILIIAIALAQLIHYLLRTVIAGLTKKTSTKMDDIILEIITMPVYYLLIFSGIYYSLKSLSIISQYNGLIDKIFIVLIVLFSAVVLAKITDVIVNSWLRVKKNKKTPQIVNLLINAVIYIIALLIILQFFDIRLTPILATLGLGALALGLALQPTLANLFAGVRILSDKPINVGDYIEIDKLSGYVEDIGWSTTRIRTLPNNIVIVPNSKLADSIVINHSMPREEIGVIVKCGVDYKSNLKKVEKITLEIAKKIQKTHTGAARDFVPFMRYEEFGDSNINFFVVLRATDYFSKYSVAHEFIKELKTRYDKEKIEISWPIRKIYRGK